MTTAAEAPGVRPADARAAAPLLSWRGAALAILFSAILTWPMLLVSGPLGYNDTVSYYAVGEAMTEVIGSKIAALAGGGEPGIGGAEAAAEGKGTMRSFAYSAFLYLSAQTGLGLYLTALLQGAVVLLVFFAFLEQRDCRVSASVALAGLAVAAGTTLPWFVSYLMPDILGAIVVMFFALAYRRIDGLSRLQIATLVALATFSVLAHYGHLPLSFGLALAVIAGRALQRRLTLFVAAVAALPLLLGSVLSLAASAIALDSASVAPRRVPILLARSITDGPAAWYLDEACRTPGPPPYAICELFDVTPRDVGGFLWSDEGIGRATREQYDRIRDEEIPILIEAFKRYPLAQTRSLLGNSAVQLLAVGTDQIHPTAPSAAPPGRAPLEVVRDDLARHPAIVLFDRVTQVVTWAAIVLLGLQLVRRRVDRTVSEAVIVVLAGLVMNALVFGGLSAPVDRYHSRLVWLVPALLAVSWLRTRRASDVEMAEAAA